MTTISDSQFASKTVRLDPCSGVFGGISKYCQRIDGVFPTLCADRLPWLVSSLLIMTDRVKSLYFLLLCRPDVDFDVRLMRAVQVMDIPMLKDFINALVMDSLTYGKMKIRAAVLVQIPTNMSKFQFDLEDVSNGWGN